MQEMSTFDLQATHDFQAIDEGNFAGLILVSGQNMRRLITIFVNPSIILSYDIE